ncbi:MAG: DUF4160 domain-containing protein [Proteobacteria bacterium]|nr:DUF4160 domain-containing protein [Pseudomonadota bacterium]
MPEISRFFGIIIKMYFDDHNPPHFHAEYSGHKALICIKNSKILEGYLPPKAYSLVAEWTYINQKELLINWERLQKSRSFEKIKPLE